MRNATTTKQTMLMLRYDNANDNHNRQNNVDNVPFTIAKMHNAKDGSRDASAHAVRTHNAARYRVKIAKKVSITKVHAKMTWSRMTRRGTTR